MVKGGNLPPFTVFNGAQMTPPDGFNEMNKGAMENSNRERKGWVEGARRAVWLVAIVFVSILIGVGLSWRMPELDLAARDWLLRSRGKIAPPPEIAIIAIDEDSIARLGRFSLPCSLVARGVLQSCPTRRYPVRAGLPQRAPSA